MYHIESSPEQEEQAMESHSWFQLLRKQCRRRKWNILLLTHLTLPSPLHLTGKEKGGSGLGEGGLRQLARGTLSRASYNSKA